METQEPNQNNKLEQTDILPSLDDAINIPSKIKRNAIVALAKGIGDLITSIIDIPTAILESISDSIRMKKAGKAAFSKVAAEVAIESFKKNPKLAERALEYFGSRIIREQQNRENVAGKTIKELKGEKFENDTSSEIDDDWLTIFWRLAETKSNEDIQQLLAKLLATEIIKPKSVSPYTLQLLSILTTDLAHSFEKFCNISIDDGNSAFVVHPHTYTFQNIGPLDDYGVSYTDLFDLDGAGLIRSAETLIVNYREDCNLEKVDYAGKPALLNVAGKQLHLIQFTRAGRELRRLIALKRNEKYTKILEKKFGNKNFQAEVPTG